MIVAGLGLVLLLAAVSRDRSPIVFVTVVTGIAALIFAAEPDAADGALGIETALPLIVAIGCAVVLLITLTVPTINRYSRTVERR